MENLHEWIGCWHDNQVFIQKLVQQEGANWLKKDDNQVLWYLKTTIEAESFLMKGKIEQAL